MWPRIAKMLGMEVAEPVPFSLTTYMADKESPGYSSAFER
jgi:hypothetical protein